MTSQKVVNNPLGSYPVLVDRNTANETRQAVGIDIGTVSGGILTESRVSASNPLPVTGTISISTAGLATEAKQDVGNTSLSTIAAKNFATETTLAALNTKVTACNTGAVVVLSSALPTGAATEATLANTLTTAAFQARINTLGQKTMANSSPVVIASDQSAVPISGSITAVLSTPIALTPAAPSAASVGVTTALALAANASRKGLVLTNTSANTISLGLAASAVLNSGITLMAGAWWVMDERTFVTGAINAIASAAASNLAIQEFT